VTCPECGGRFRVPRTAPAPESLDAEAITPTKPGPAPPPQDEADDEAEPPRPRRRWRFDVAPYRPDGGVTAPGVVLTFALEALAGVVLGLLSAFIGHWFYLVLLFPLLVGLGLGCAGLLGVGLGKVRNPLIAGLAGVLGACVASATGQLFEYVGFLADRAANRQQIEAVAAWQPAPVPGPPVAGPAPDEVQDARARLAVDGFFGFVDFSARRGVTISRAGSFNDKGMNLGHVGSYIYWGVEFLIMAAVAFAIMRKAATDPFCTACRSWKKDHRLGSLRPPAEEAADALRAGKLGRLDDHDPSTRKKGDLRLHVAVCPNCHDDSPIDVRLVRVTQVQGRDQQKVLAHVTYPGEALAALEELFPGARIGEKE
jgi:hypothetical protein